MSNPLSKLNPVQQAALRTFAATAGANWRAMLIECWANGDSSQAIRQVRERIGGAGALWKIKTSDLKPVSAMDEANDRIERAQAAVADREPPFWPHCAAIKKRLA